MRRATSSVSAICGTARGLTNEAAQAIRLAKSWRTKFERLEKAAA